MNPDRANEFGRALTGFFRECLPALRGMSRHTLCAYRDAIVLFLRFVAEHAGRGIEDIDLDSFTSEQVSNFLAFLEHKRHNSITTRNARLAVS